MRICDSAGSKWDREEVESKDAWICHWGKKGLQGSVLTTSSCLTNGGSVFRIDLRRRPDLGDFVVNVTCLFFIQFVFIQLSFLAISLFPNSGLPLFPAISKTCSPSSQSHPVYPSPFCIHLLSLHHHSLLSVCHLCLCPCLIIMPSSICLFPLLISLFLLIHILIFLCLFISPSPFLRWQSRLVVSETIPLL